MTDRKKIDAVLDALRWAIETGTEPSSSWASVGDALEDLLDDFEPKHMLVTETAPPWNPTDSVVFDIADIPPDVVEALKAGDPIAEQWVGKQGVDTPTGDCVCGHRKDLHYGDTRETVHRCGAQTEGRSGYHGECGCTQYISRWWFMNRIQASDHSDESAPAEWKLPNSFAGTEVLKDLLMDGQVYVSGGYLEVNNCDIRVQGSEDNCQMCQGSCPVPGGHQQREIKWQDRQRWRR